MSKSKRWCFTLNNYTAQDESLFLEIPAQYVVYGRESSTTLTPHLQGFITFKTDKRLSGVKKICSRAHWEIAKGTSKQASDYCKKSGDFEERGEVPSQGCRTDLNRAIETLKSHGLKACALEYPEVYVKYSRGLRDLSLVLQTPYEHHEVRGIWIFGPPGTGKSFWARETYKNPYIKAQNKWFDGYAGEDVILLEDLDTDVLGHYIKIWSDRYSCTGETKGGTVHLSHKTFVVTSNYHPCELFKDPLMAEAVERRFRIFNKDTIDTPILLE